MSNIKIRSGIFIKSKKVLNSYFSVIIKVVKYILIAFRVHVDMLFMHAFTAFALCFIILKLFKSTKFLQLITINAGRKSM